MGFSTPEELEVFTLQDVHQKFYVTEPGFVGGFQVQVSQDQVQHARSVYTILDWLGDVGGLIDALKLIAHLLVALFSGGSMSGYLISQLFYKPQPRHSP